MRSSPSFVLATPPQSAPSFDHIRHILRGDLIFGPPGAHLILKWAKSMQAATSHQVIQIPALPGSKLFPVDALKAILHYALASPSAPLFLLPGSPPSVLTAPTLSGSLKKLLTTMDLNPGNYGFHCFRRSAVTWAVNNGIPFQSIKLHGGWVSSTVHKYIKSTPKASSLIPHAFQKLLN